jgi:hypothetical protein
MSQQFKFSPQQFSQSMLAQYMNSSQMIQSQIFQNSQQFQASSLNINSDSVITILLISSSSINSQNSRAQAYNVDTESDSEEKKHIRFLSTMIEMNKTFRISCSIVKSTDEIVKLEKIYTNVDQESDMNVISSELMRFLELAIHDLEEVEFRELFMRTTNDKETVLHH